MKSVGADDETRTRNNQLGRLRLYQLNYVRIMVGVTGFEPATLWSQTRCATKLRYTPIIPHVLSILHKSDKERV